MKGLDFEIQNLGCWAWVWGSALSIQEGTRCRMQGCRAMDSSCMYGFRVQGFRGLGFRLTCTVSTYPNKFRNA